MDNRILNSNAVQKLDTPKPSINLSANKMIPAFITKRKSPKVIIVIGNVKMTKIGFTNKLRIESTTATIMAPT